VKTRSLAVAMPMALTLLAGRGVGQSAHLSALEASAPVAVGEPLTGGTGLGISGLFTDPTSAPRATGALFSVFHSTYASVKLYHAVAAFRAGPRWSVYYAATEIKNLFDTSLTNVDPTLAELQARALLFGVDGAMTIGPVTVSAGLGCANDDNVGERTTSAVSRVHSRVSLSRGSSFGLHWSKAHGDAGRASGRLQADIAVERRWSGLTSGVTLAVVRGAPWKYTEIRNGIAAGAHVAFASTLDVRLGVGRYATTFGAADHEWRRSASVGIAVAGVRVAATYTGTRLGLGSGYGISFGYEPREQGAARPRGR
jgi:hypothetical protein